MKRPLACNGGPQQHREEEERDRGERPPRTERREREPTHTGNRARTDKRAQHREPRRQAGEWADETKRSAATTARPSEATFPRREPTRRARSNRAGDEQGPDATGQIQGRETPDASRQPEGGHTPGQAGKTDGRDEFEPGPNEGQHRIQKARTEPQRSQNRQTGKHRGQESPDLNLRSIPDGAPPPQPRVGSPACRGSVRCIPHCFRGA